MEAVHESFDAGGGGEAGAVAKGEEGGDLLLVGRSGWVVGGGTENGKVESGCVWFGQESCFAHGSLVFEDAEEISELGSSSHRIKDGNEGRMISFGSFKGLGSVR